METSQEHIDLSCKCTRHCLCVSFTFFLQYRDGLEGTCIANIDFANQLKRVISNLHFEEGHFQGVREFLHAQGEFKERTLIPLFKEFSKFREEMSQKLETFRFWDRFLTQDMASYINLWLAIRTRNRSLRMAALKDMAPLLFAFDRRNYSRLIPLHLSKLYALTPHVLNHFENGCFATSIKGTNFSSVAFDEAHEMLINKECKTAVNNCMPEHMEQLVGTIEYQAQLMRTFEDSLGVHSSTYS